MQTVIYASKTRRTLPKTNIFNVERMCSIYFTVRTCCILSPAAGVASFRVKFIPVRRQANSAHIFREYKRMG